MPRCVAPKAPWVKCWICLKPTKTCERKRPKYGYDYSCPAHPDVGQLSGIKRWVCSYDCWELACRILEKRGKKEQPF